MFGGFFSRRGSKSLLDKMLEGKQARESQADRASNEAREQVKRILSGSGTLEEKRKALLAEAVKKAAVVGIMSTMGRISDVNIWWAQLSPGQKNLVQMFCAITAGEIYYSQLMQEAGE